MGSNTIYLDLPRYKQGINNTENSVERTQTSKKSYPTTCQNTKSLKNYEEIVKNIIALMDEFKTLSHDDFGNISNAALNFEKYEQKVQDTF